MKRLIRSVRDFFRREIGITVLRRTIASLGSELVRVTTEFSAAYAASDERHQRTLTEFQAAYAASEERHRRILIEFQAAYAASEERHQRTQTEFQSAYAASEERHQRTLAEVGAAVRGLGAALDAVGGRQEAGIAELFEAMKGQHAVLREARVAADLLASTIKHMCDARDASEAHQVSILALLLNGQHHADETILEIRNLAEATLIRRR